MPTHKRVRCTIHTKNGPLHEYRDSTGTQSPNPSTQTVYVQAEDEGYFWIVCEALPDYKYTLGDRITFHIYVDGRVTGTQTVGPSHPHKEHRGALFDGFSEIFQFAKIPPDTPHSVKSKDVPFYDSSSGVGGISVDVIRSKHLKHVKYFGMRPFRNPPRDEEALKRKGLTHVTRRGIPEHITPSAGWTVCKTESIDTTVNPFARFHFLYRSKEALQSLGLVPRTPSPSPSPSATDLEATEEIPRPGAKAHSLKGKEKEEDRRSEAKGPRTKRRRLSGREISQVIDLTADD